jgi:hypothetical protein
MSEEQTTLTQAIQSVAQTYFDKINGKSIEDLGGTDAVVFMLMNELVNVYQCMTTIAVNFDNFLTVYEANQIIIDNNFSVFNDALTQVRENLAKQDAALAESLSKSLQSLNKQMTNQNKVFDKQVIKLSKSISKITGGNS